MKSSSISDPTVFSRFSGARIDLSAEDNAIALTLAECPPRPYAELIKSDIPGSSSSKFAPVGDAVSEASEYETESSGLR